MPHRCATGWPRCSADGSGFCDAVFLAQAHRAASARDEAALARDCRTRRRLRALARAPARDHDAGPRLHRDRALGLGLRRARRAWSPLAAARSSIPSRSASSARRMRFRWRRRCTRSCMRVVSNWISAGARLVPLGQTDSQRILAALEADVVADRQARAAKLRSTISAAPPSAPISPACATRRNIRGCSGHEWHPSRRPCERRDP